LFCEAIFGPTRNYECSCGKYKGARYKGFVCERCGVEIAPARVRRERMGHIELAAPVVHVWYYKTTPSRIGLLLNLSVTEIEKILYFVKYVATAEFDEKKKVPVIQSLEESYKSRLNDLEEVFAEEIAKAKEEGKGKKEAERQMLLDLEGIYKENKLELEREYSRMKSIIASLKPGGTILESDYRNFFNKFNHIFGLKSGSDALLELLTKIKLDERIQEASERFNAGKGEDRKKTFKLLRLLINLYVSETRPEWMVMTHLPVIPPDIRPVISLE
jgi:DNA-directed RNA polymerase subunit beta'